MSVERIGDDRRKKMKIAYQEAVEVFTANQKAKLLLDAQRKIEDGVPFSLSCFECDAGDGVTGLIDAQHQGWTDLQYDDGMSWNFLGMCPECGASQ